MSKTSKVHKIKAENRSPSVQADDNKNKIYIDPPISFDALILAYESSFML